MFAVVSPFLLSRGSVASRMKTSGKTGRGGGGRSQEAVRQSKAESTKFESAFGEGEGQRLDRNAISKRDGAPDSDDRKDRRAPASFPTASRSRSRREECE